MKTMKVLFVLLRSETNTEELINVIDRFSKNLRNTILRFSATIDFLDSITKSDSEFILIRIEIKVNRPEFSYITFSASPLFYTVGFLIDVNKLDNFFTSILDAYGLKIGDYDKCFDFINTGYQKTIHKNCEFTLGINQSILEMSMGTDKKHRKIFEYINFDLGFSIVNLEIASKDEMLVTDIYNELNMLRIDNTMLFRRIKELMNDNDATIQS